MKTFQIIREVFNGANHIQASKDFVCVNIASSDEENRLYNNCHLFAKSDNLKYILAGSSYRVRFRIKKISVVSIDSFTKAVNDGINSNIDLANRKIRELNRALDLTNRRLCRQNQDKLQEIDKFDYQFVDKYELEINEDTLDVIVY